jgi:hypothetical protein
MEIQTDNKNQNENDNDKYNDTHNYNENENENETNKLLSLRNSETIKINKLNEDFKNHKKIYLQKSNKKI